MGRDLTGDDDLLTSGEVLALMESLGRPIARRTLYGYESDRRLVGWPGVARRVGRISLWSRAAVTAYVREVRGAPLTTEQSERIVALYRDKVRVSEIMRRLGLDFRRIEAVLDAAGLPRRMVGPDALPRPDADALRTAYVEEGSIRRLAHRLGVGQSTVGRWLAAAGISALPREPRKSTAERTIPSAERLHHQHHEQLMSVAEMGRHWDASEALVAKWLGYRRVPQRLGDDAATLRERDRIRALTGRSKRPLPDPPRPPEPTPVELPRLLERPHGSSLLTRAEVADRLGYSRTSMATVMSRHPDRWPRPAALLRQGRAWVMLWDSDEIDAAAPPAAAHLRAGGVATVSDPDGLLTCLELECGRRLRSLGRHLHAAHDLTADEYRERHRLPATAALEADGVRQAGSDRQRALLAADPAALAHLDPYRSSEHLDQLRETAIDALRETRDHDLVRAHRAPGQRYAVQVMAARRRERLDDIARRAGYPSLAEAIADTVDMSAPAAAARIGIGASTVRRHRTAPTTPAGEDRSLPARSGPPHSPRPGLRRRRAVVRSGRRSGGCGRGRWLVGDRLVPAVHELPRQRRFTSTLSLLAGRGWGSNVIPGLLPDLIPTLIPLRTQPVR